MLPIKAVVSKKACVYICKYEIFMAEFIMINDNKDDNNFKLKSKEVEH